jgi:broad specificity phosphatase PhoE
MQKTLGGLYEGESYFKAMQEAREEFLEWERDKKRNRKTTKEKYKAQRLAKLDMLGMRSY